MYGKYPCLKQITLCVLIITGSLLIRNLTVADAESGQIKEPPQPCRQEIKRIKPMPIELISSIGYKATEFQLNDTIQVRAADLKPHTGYTVRVVDETGKLIRSLKLSTDETGRIPETILWHDIGTRAIPAKKRPERAYVAYFPEWAIIDSSIANQNYHVQILDEYHIVSEMTFHVEDRLKRPRLYAADTQGHPTTGFIIGEKDVWVVGKNFPRGAVVRLWAVLNSDEWHEGEYLNYITHLYLDALPALFELAPAQTCFRKKLWPKDQTSLGSYDIIAETLTYPWGQYYATGTADVQNVAASLRHSGFVVQKRPGENEPLEMNLAGTRQSPLTYQETFLPTEHVYVGVDPAVQPSYIGQTAAIYIVDNRNHANWPANTILQDVTGFSETVTIYGVCGNCWATLAWAPPLTPGEYDVVLDFNLNGKYDPGIDLIDSLDPVGFTVSQIRVESVSFNYSGSSGLTIYDNDPAVSSNITAPEYSAGATSLIKPAAWVRGGTRQVRVEFKADAAVSSAQIWATGGLGGLNSSTSPVTVAFSGGTGQVDFTVNSNPNAVGKHKFYWNWKYRTGSTTYNMGRTGEHTVYTTLQTPIASLSPPWLEILDYSCTWAGGATSNEQVCTYMLNNGFKNHYNWNMDCHRLASDFVRLIGMQGVPGSLHRWASIGSWGALNDMAYQRTKAVDPVGPAWNYGQIDWSWHQWAEAEGKQRDAAAGVSLSGNWGAYEDDLFAQYKNTTATSPYAYQWIASQPGQNIGCEAPAHRQYQSYPPHSSMFTSWRGPDF